MIDITKAQANQTTNNGVHEDWVVTLDNEVLYKLPAHFSVQETFFVRDIIEVMMKKAAEEAREQVIQLSMVKENRIVSNGNAQLEVLKNENARLSMILEKP